MRVSLIATIVATTTVSLSAVTFTENFDAGWSGSGDWSKEGVFAPSVVVEEFPAGDSRLMSNAGITAGGFYYENGVSGDDTQYIGGDNEQIFLDYHMPVANGIYTFDVSLDTQMYWSNLLQDYGQGLAMYIGDASDMAYGIVLPGQAPTGPWQSVSHNVPVALETALTGTQWNGANIPNGEWKHWNFTKMGGTAVDTIEVTSGEVIFRMTIQLKNADQTSPEFRSWAMDNLSITLTPEPTSMVMLALSSLVIVRRRR